MTESNKWKSKLLSSSFPLEFETAKLLAQKGFYIQSDFSYERSDSGSIKDFSVDILATAYAPFNNPNKISIDMELLVECKYRSDNTTWLFLPDINEESLIVSGYFMRTVDNFSPSKFTATPKLSKFADECCYAYKATEIKMTSEPSVYDTEIKHGLSQLQYALPNLIHTKIELSGLYPHEDNVPFVICPILVTTAKLLLADKSVTVKSVAEANSIDDLGTQVPYLIIEYDCGPDFERHCRRVFKDFCDLSANKGVQELEELRNKSRFKEYDFEYPSAIGHDLATSSRSRMVDYFTQFIVCNFEDLPALVDILKSIVSDASRYKRAF